MMNFWHMGGYALYVWPCYFLVITILLLNATIARRRYKSTLQNLRQTNQD